MTVYSPSDDTRLLGDHLKHLDLQGKRFLDMGTGSGYLAEIAVQKGAEVVAVDINEAAVEEARDRLPEDVDVFCSDLFEKVESKFDLVVFNPPYLSGRQGIGDENIWRGGKTGVETSNRFLESVDYYLKSGGSALLIFSSNSDFESTLESFDLEIVDSKKIWFEELFLARYK